MVQQVLEIPGYYYDKEKKKYFKIQHPSSSTAAYSSHHVKRLKLSDEREEAKKVELEKQHGRIKRSHLLEEPSTGGLMCRSSGRTALDASRIFSAGLVGQGQIITPILKHYYVFEIDPRPERYGMQSEVWSASQDGLTLLYTQLGRYNGIKFDNNTLSPVPNSSHIDLPIHRVSENLGNGIPTSMSINQSCRQVAATWLSDHLGDPSRIRICHLTRIEKNTVDRDRSAGRVVEDPPPTLSGGLQAFHNEGDIYASTAAPAQSSLRFAFGTRSGILTLDKSTSLLEPLQQGGHTRHEAKLKDTFALEFLSRSHDHNILLSGNRKGNLNITDLRYPRFDNTANIIYHPSSITHIKHLDQHRILVAGLKSSLCQYDLRFIKQDTFSRPPLRKNSRKHPSPQKTLHTRPILTFPEYHNTATINIGFDVDLQTGIVAAAQEHAFHLSTVQLFSLHGGNALRCRALERDFGPLRDRDRRVEASDTVPIRCLRWASDVEGKMRSLYVGTVNGMRRYTWAEEEEEVDMDTGMNLS